MPLVSKTILNTLCLGLKNKKKEIFVPVYNKKVGNPLAFKYSMIKSLKKIKGDRGAKKLIRSNKSKVQLVKIKSKSIGTYREPLQTLRNPKAISTETTFREDLTDSNSIIAELTKLSSKLSLNAAEKSLKGKTIRLKVRFNDFSTHTSQITLESPTNEYEILHDAAIRLLERIMKQALPVRLLGISLSNFDTKPTLQLSLL